MKIVVCGDREWRDLDKIQTRLAAIPWEDLPPSDVTIIHGDCRGADRIAGHVARRLGMVVVPVPAKWTELGLAAGPIRNQVMIDMVPDLVLAFHSNLSKSTGTIDTINRAKLARIPFEVIT